MPKLRLYEFDLIVSSINDTIDELGRRYLFVRGYHRYNAVRTNGCHYHTIDTFNFIALYGSSQLLDETIKRFNEFKRKNKKFILNIIDADISTKLKKNMINVCLYVYYYDFKENKFGTRRLMNKIQKEKLKEKDKNNNEKEPINYRDKYEYYDL